MTAAKRWPKVAEAARLESIAAAMGIGDLGQEAKAAVRAGKRELAMMLIAEMQLAAKAIELELIRCKGHRGAGDG